MSNKWILAKRQSSMFALILSLCSSVVFAAENNSLDDYIQRALTSNQQLQAASLDLDSSLSSLDAVRAAYRPKLALQARYSRNDGGREINFPIGDALNPVYRSLNQLTANTANPTQFPDINNVEVAFLRERDQDTRLNLSAPIYAPAIDAAIRQAVAQTDNAAAQREVLARTLVRDVRVAYYSYGLASSAVEIYAASENVLTENLRVNQALLKSGTVTRDQPLRAEAELLAIRDQRIAADNRKLAAGRYLNLLANRDLQTPLPTEIIAGEIAPVKATLTPASRPELKQLSANIAIAQASAKSARADRLPTIALSIDGGIQGTDYDFGRGRNFASANLVFNWRLFDSFQSRRAETAALQKADALRARQQALTQQLELLAKGSDDDLSSAQARASTAQARLVAAEESFRISERKRDAGTITQIQFLDAERALTEARLAASNAAFDIAIRHAERELAYASYPLSASLLATVNAE